MQRECVWCVAAALHVHSALGKASRGSGKIKHNRPIHSLFFFFGAARVPLSCPPLCTRADAMADAGYVLPDKWSDDLVDEKGEKLSKR